MATTRLLWACALLLALLAMASVRSLPAETPDATVIVAHEFMFAPTSITVKTGSTVTWTNKDEEPHTIVSDTGLFRSGAIDTDESFSFRFDNPGTYHYACSIHPRMVGTIVVQ